MSEVKRYRSAALGALPVCAHWTGPDVVLATDFDAQALELQQLRGDFNIAILQRDAKLCSECPRSPELQVMREALEAIKAKCAAPALKSYQHEAVLFAYRTADAALKAAQVPHE